MNELFVSDDAKGDIKDGAEYYENQQTDLGHDFVDKIEEALIRIQQNPKQFPAIYREVRRVLVGRFPYQMLFFVKGVKIVVFAAFHTSRNSDKWKNRADDELLK